MRWEERRRGRPLPRPRPLCGSPPPSPKDIGPSYFPITTYPCILTKQNEPKFLPFHKIFTRMFHGNGLMQKSVRSKGHKRFFGSLTVQLSPWGHPGENGQSLFP
jgi:hypothetical protein